MSFAQGNPASSLVQPASTTSASLPGTDVRQESEAVSLRSQPFGDAPHTVSVIEARASDQPQSTRSNETPAEESSGTQHDESIGEGASIVTHKPTSTRKRAAKFLYATLSLLVAGAGLSAAFLYGRLSERQNNESLLLNRESMLYNKWRACQDIPTIRTSQTCFKLADKSFDALFDNAIRKRSDFATDAPSHLLSSSYQNFLLELLRCEVRWLRPCLAYVLCIPMDIGLRLLPTALVMSYIFVTLRGPPKYPKLRFTLVASGSFLTVVASIMFLRIAACRLFDFGLAALVVLFGATFWDVHSKAVTFSACLTGILAHYSKTLRVFSSSDVLSMFNSVVWTLSDLRVALRNKTTGSEPKIVHDGHFSSLDFPWLTFTLAFVVLFTWTYTTYMVVAPSSTAPTNRENLRLEEAIALVTKAVDLDRSGEYEEAYLHYCEALDSFKVALKHETHMKAQRLLRTKMAEYKGRAELIKKHLDDIKQHDEDSKYRKKPTNFLRW